MIILALIVGLVIGYTLNYYISSDIVGYKIIGTAEELNGDTLRPAGCGNYVLCMINAANGNDVWACNHKYPGCK